MQIAILKERREYERRVAASPETVKKYIAAGFSVVVETGAGFAADITDKAFEQAGAKIAGSAKDACAKADLILKVQRPMDGEIANFKKGALLVCAMSPFQSTDIIQACAKAGVDAFALELIPRITRAQSMDILSSQSNLAGYKAVLDAAAEYGRVFPMMMTAAGTVAPAKVMVFGAGVAGLQAIATAKRLGAVVSATDVRLAAKEQVQSLGGSFVMVEDDEVKQAETSGGYAKEMSAEYKKKQAALIEETLVKQDIAITTALIPGRAAPILITKAMVAQMKPGSVIVDLAVEQGGNCELSKAGEIIVTDNGVKILGHLNVPSRLATDASILYAKNVMNFVMLMWNSADKKLVVNFEDEIIKATALTHQGKILWADAQQLKDVKDIKAAAPKIAKKAPVKKATVKKTAAKKK